MQLQFALLKGARIEATPGLSAECPHCGKPVVAKCGPIRVWHWAHRGSRTCDPWWENQTPWHRIWQSGFPVEWREVVVKDGGGEKHIADVKTPHGLCVEFQHSHLRQTERAAREAFYCPNLIWIVDGNRRSRDLRRFLQGQRCFRRISETPFFLVPFPNECFPRDWLECRAPVFFDFQGTPHTEAADAVLWGLLPARLDRYAVAVAMTRRQFIQAAHQGPEIIPRKTLALIARAFRRQREVERRQTRTLRSAGQAILWHRRKCLSWRF